MGAIDLHMHTTASDGTLSPAELVALAAERRLRAIAITDHDSIAGLDAALSVAEEHDLEVIPGVEISTDVPKGEVHVLGYFIEWHDEDFQNLLAKLREGRLQRGLKMVEKLKDLGAPISMDRVLELADGGAVGRPHVAQALLEAGHVSSINEAFHRYIGRAGPAYAERYKLSPAGATRHIRSARGVPVLAHPVRADRDGGVEDFEALESWVAELVDAGLQGVECYYTGYTAEVTEHLLQVAKAFGLVATGGSDYHGPDRLEDAELGGVAVPEECVQALHRLREKNRASGCYEPISSNSPDHANPRY